MTQMVAPMTDFRGVSRIDKHQRDTSRLSLVGDKLPQLVKRPTGVAVALRLAHLRPLPNARQVFQGNLALRRMSFLDKLFADPVVDRSHVALLSPRQPFQKPLRFLRAFGLKRTPDFGIAGTHAVDLGGFVELLVGIDCDTASPEINTQRACGCQRDRSGSFELHMQEECPITAFDEHRTRRRLSLEASFLEVTQGGLKTCTATQKRQTESPIPFPEAEDACIVVHRGRRKGRMHLGRDFERRTDASYGTDSKIRRQTKPRAYLSVASLLHFDLIRCVFFPRHISNKSTRIGKSHKRRIQLKALLVSWREFAGNRAYCLHEGILSHVYVTCNTSG